MSALRTRRRWRRGYDLAGPGQLMESKSKSPARFVAPVALAVVAVVLIVVVTSSISGGGDESKQAAKQEKKSEGPGDKYYIVQPGDSFSVIAEKEGIDQELLEQLNPDLDPQALAPGQQVRLR
jgi:LysM repeat protein